MLLGYRGEAAAARWCLCPQSPHWLPLAMQVMLADRAARCPEVVTKSNWLGADAYDDAFSGANTDELMPAVLEAIIIITICINQ